MKNKQTSTLSGTNRAKVTRLFSEKTLLIFFAAASLTFALAYTFAHSSVQAESTTIAAAAPLAAAGEQTDSINNSAADTSASPAAVADVVQKALAFKASLTTAQQATLEKTYTTTLARRWSNLPCGSNCRNGIQFSTLTSAQLALALQVIQAAAGTTANEGSDEFNQIRAADDYLGANGGGSGYSGGIYFIAFLNTPSTSGGWMLQYGGHHYGANIAFNQGHFVGATPQFEGVEPTSFAINGTTYAPLEQERAALQNALASLTTEQLTAARLSQTFSDVTLAPGESNGGSGTFPATKVGIAVNTLSTAQQLLVLEAMKPWVKDLDDTVATNLLAIYQSEMSGTYLSYTGAGTSGTPSSFLTANTNYARIDGATAWIEFVCQNGVVFRNQIHYHSVYRDRVRDYGADLSLTTPLDNPTSAASKVRFDFDGDAKADLAVFRPSTGTWYVQRSTSGFVSQQWGADGDIIAPADFDGDGKTDLAVFRPTNGTWYVFNLASATVTATQFGQSGDVPRPADFDGDGKADLAVFRASTGIWYRFLSANSQLAVTQFGQTGDVPQASDYDGDGKADLGVFRPASGTWYRTLSATAEFVAAQFGQSGDLPDAADYDGDGKADLAVFRSSNGTWYVQQSTAGFLATQFGQSGDRPAAADFDGDGRADIAVFRSSNGTWYSNRTTAGFTSTQFGQTGDAPAAAAFVSAN